MIPIDPGTALAQPSEVWMSKTVQNPALLSSMLYGAANHEFTLRQLEGAGEKQLQRQDRLQMMIAEHEAIRRINTALQDPSQQLSDELILAIFFMGFSRCDETVFATRGQPHRSPLRNLQWAEIYSLLDYDSTHIAGLCQIISLKGGIGPIRIPALRMLLSLATTMLASKFLIKPLFPYISLSDSYSQPDWPPGIALLLPIYGKEDFDELLSLGLPTDLVHILRDMYSYSIVIKLYSQGIVTGASHMVMADRRNWIQHRLLSLPTADELETVSPVYEAIRLAAISYSLLTIFPLVYSQAPFYDLSRLLIATLAADANSEMPKSCWSSIPKFVIWVSVIGGIVSTEMETTMKFVSILDHSCTKNGVFGWEDLQKVLKSVMWVDKICDEWGEELWMKVVRLKS
jgi:hypothetical protein